MGSAEGISTNFRFGSGESSGYVATKPCGTECVCVWGGGGGGGWEGGGWEGGRVGGREGGRVGGNKEGRREGSNEGGEVGVEGMRT